MSECIWRRGFEWCRLLLLIRCRFAMRRRKRKIGTMVLLHPSWAAAAFDEAQKVLTFLLGSKTYLMRESLMDNISGNSSWSLLASSSLLLRAATITLACSSRVKFLYVKLGSTYFLYISRISLWLTTPGFVKFQMPRRLRFAISIEMGSSSSRMVIELGMLTTFSYRVILVMKLRGVVRSPVIGIRTRNVHTLSNSFKSSSTCNKPPPRSSPRPTTSLQTTTKYTKTSTLTSSWDCTLPWTNEEIKGEECN